MPDHGSLTIRLVILNEVKNLVGDSKTCRPRTSIPTGFFVSFHSTQNDRNLSLRGAAGDVGVSQVGVRFTC